MGKDREVIIAIPNYKDCPDLFCNIILKSDKGSFVTSLSRGEAEEVLMQLEEKLK